MQLASIQETEARRTEQEIKKLHEAGLCGRKELARASRARRFAETRMARRQLDYVEILKTGRKPRNDLAAPLVEGRDFVSERLLLDLALAKFNIESYAAGVAVLEKLHQSEMASKTELDSARRPLETAKTMAKRLERRLTLRARFRQGKIGERRVVLLALRDDARLDKRVAQLRLDAARQELGRLEALAKAGLATRGSLGDARVRVRELEAGVRMATGQIELVTRELTGK